MSKHKRGVCISNAKKKKESVFFSKIVKGGYCTSSSVFFRLFMNFAFPAQIETALQHLSLFFFLLHVHAHTGSSSVERYSSWAWRSLL